MLLVVVGLRASGVQGLRHFRCERGLVSDCDCYLMPSNQAAVPFKGDRLEQKAGGISSRRRSAILHPVAECECQEGRDSSLR
jgi:hypothetical protein